MFNPDQFLDMTITDSNSTQTVPVPVGEYTALVSDVKCRQWQSKADPSKSGLTLDVTWEVDDAAVKQLLGRDKVTVKAKAIKGKASDLKMVAQGCADSGVCYPPVNSDGTSTKVKGTTQFCKVVPIIGKHFC